MQVLEGFRGGFRGQPKNRQDFQEVHGFLNKCVVFCPRYLLLGRALVLCWAVWVIMAYMIPDFVVHVVL